MKKTIIFGAFSIITIVFTACSGGTTKEQAKDTTAASSITVSDSSSGKMMAHEMYTCTMHPEVMSDKPGKCPKCGMDLVKKEMNMDSSMKMNMDSMKH